MSRITHWFQSKRHLDWNWHGAVVALVLLGLLLGDLALFGHTATGYIGLALIVAASAILLRFEIGPRWLHR
jgi:hypothetical protein